MEDRPQPPPPAGPGADPARRVFEQGSRQPALPPACSAASVPFLSPMAP